MILVIGGGPAGMMAAVSAALSADPDNKITLLEKNPSLGRKLLLTGGGRCNLTNACDPRDLVCHYSKTGNFLRDAFKAFGNKELLKFFTARGLAFKREDGGRMFPVTDKASSVLGILEKELDDLGVKVLRGRAVKDIIIEKGAVKGVRSSDGSVMRAEKVIIATGGLSYKETGSTGDGMKMAENTGHRIVSPRPGLVSLRLSGKRAGELEGISLDAVRLAYRSGKRKFASSEGSLLFTGGGISGPVTLSSSARAVDWMEEGKEVSVEIDLAPSSSISEIEETLLSAFTAYSGKSVKNILRGMVPARLADALLDAAVIKASKKANQVTAAERKRLAGIFKAFKFDIMKSDSFKKAQVTRGGVSVKDIDPRTMGSKKVKGLYFAGELTDVDGDCGGYNLQAAFSTGYLAGRSAAGSGESSKP